MTTTREARNQPLELDDEMSAIAYCYQQGWTDGLPVVPPTTALVDEMLEASGEDPESILATHTTTGRQLPRFNSQYRWSRSVGYR